MICPKCNAERRNAKFCRTCGKPLLADPLIATWVWHRRLAEKSKAPEKREAHRMASEAIADAINRLSGNPDERFGGPPLPGQEIPVLSDPEPGSATPQLFDATDSEIEKTLAK